MNIDTLFMFIEIVNNGSITKAAERLHVSQSALSQQIKSMENSFGCRLLDRSNQGVSMTPAGEAVYQRAQEILGIYQTLVNQLEVLQKKDRCFHILSMDVIYTYALPCALFQIQKKFQEVRLETKVMPSAQIEQKINAGQGDIGFIVGPPVNKELYSRFIFSDPVHLVMTPRTRKREKMALEELKQLPMMMISGSHRTQQKLDAYLAQKGVPGQQLNVTCEFESFESAKQSVINGMGAAFLPYSSIKKELYNKQLEIIEIEDFEFKFRYYLIKNPKLQQDVHIKELFAYLERMLDSMIC